MLYPTEPAPTAQERRAWTELIALRVRRLLLRRGLLREDGASDDGGEPLSVLDACQAASVRNVAAMGARAGRPLRKIVLPGLARGEAGAEGRAIGGFDLDIGPVVRATERARLERLCRYLLRPALAADRLQQMPDGRVRVSLRRTWRDGTTAVVMEPLEFIERLAALVPAPGRHQVRYHGTLAPNSAWRGMIVPGVKEGGDGVSGAASSCGGAQGDGSASKRETKGSTRIAWADLLKRVFAVDVLECPRCSGRMRIIATVMDPEAVRKILACIGLPTRGPPLAPPREREQGEFGFG